MARQRRPKVRVQSNFLAMKGVAKMAIDNAVEEALITGQEEAQARLSASGYDLDPFEVKRKNFGEGEGGMIFVHSDKWYYRFFEYGTVYIRATPFMRPAHRKMKKAFAGELGESFTKFVSARTALRRFSR